MVLAFGLLMVSPMATVYAQGEQTLNFAADGSAGVTIGAKGYTFTGGTLQEHTGTYRITGSTDFTIGSASPITVNGGADASVLLDSAVLSTNQGRALIRVAGNSTLRLVLRGTNRVTRTAGNGCGIQVDEGSTLIISGESDEASLDVIGGAYSPAIGAQGGASAAAPGVGGKVVIQGGTVTAAGGANAAAIGGGRFSYADVEITGGTVEATEGTTGPESAPDAKRPAVPSSSAAARWYQRRRECRGAWRRLQRLCGGNPHYGRPCNRPGRPGRHRPGAGRIGRPCRHNRRHRSGDRFENRRGYRRHQQRARFRRD